MKLSIVILNYKKKELTFTCIASLYKEYQKQFEKNEFEIIVVDNNSQDNSVEFLKKIVQKNKWKSITLIKNAKNLGFGSGCNIAAEKSNADYLLFLNSDTKVLDDGIIGMVDFLDSRPHIGIVGGKMENEDRTPQASAGKFYNLFNVFLMLLGLQRFGLVYTSFPQIQKIDWVSGACMMVRRNVFEKIGGFDIEMFMYVEDVDICYRAKKAGFLTYYYPFVFITHAGQGSSNRSFAIVHIYEGLMHFYKKHMPYWQVWVLQCILKVKAIVLINVGKLLHNEYLITTYEEAFAIFR